MVDIPSSPNPSKSYGKPGNDGWGLAALVKDPGEGGDKINDSRSERRDSISSDGIRDSRREGTFPGGHVAGLGLGGNSGFRGKERESVPREREAPKKKLMGHPCASGCGHVCWVANDLVPSPPRTVVV